MLRTKPRCTPIPLVVSNVIQDGWKGMPSWSDEAVESEAVCYIHSIVEWMRCLDHDGATWTVGTTSSPEERLATLEGTQEGHAICGWCRGSPKRGRRRARGVPRHGTGRHP